MATLSTSIPSLSWPSDFSAISIAATAESSVSVKISISSTEIFNSTLIADSSGVIIIYDIDRLLRDWMGSTPMDVHLSFDNSKYDYIILPYDGIMTVSATDFCNQRFLSSLAGTKYTHIQAKEYISFYQVTSSTVTATIDAIWTDGTNTQKTTKTVYTSNSALGLIQNIDVSPNILTAPKSEFMLVAYSVTIEHRKQSYRIVPNGMAQNITDVTFINAFGMLETFHFFGNLTRDLKPSRSSAIISGRKTNYNIEAIPEWTAETGPLTDGMLELFDDIVCAKQAWRTSDGCAIVITDSDNKQNNSDDTIPSGSVSWNEDKTARMFIAKNWGIRIFDKTFDATYE